ncbi:hypothetical protein BCR35DRAFT_306490 [Leucosporidium creatinivorum]|uniref:Uncharacterized protein n=1 Tax=Leucosporidium creatinivorum TaxID=106004 RepID=A0A1Y2EU23_9BASI|nr:hypothetical protein BCR35DRAFT_306490 [Leucosporidium creatinivorum]
MFASREVHAGLFQGALVGQQGRGSDGHMHRTLTGASRALQLDSLRGVSAQPRADGSTDVKSLDHTRLQGNGTLMHLDQDLGASPSTIPQSRSSSTPAISALTPNPALSAGSPQTREELAKLLEGMEFGKKITKLEITLSISIQITRTIVKMSRSVAPHNSPAPVLVIHCTRLPDHKGVLATPELKRWEPVDVQPHKQQYLYIVSETKKITINVTFKLIKVEKK